MRKIKLYIAMSLNGKIAGKDGDVKWLEAMPNPDKLDYGFTKMYDEVDTTIQGYSSYAQVMSWDIDFPYAGKKNYVITRKEGLSDTEHAAFISTDHINRIREIKAEDGKDIWLIGGGQINTMLLDAQLLDEIEVFVMPIVLSEGIELFEAIPPEVQLDLIECTKYPTGVVSLKYVPRFTT